MCLHGDIKMIVDDIVLTKLAIVVTYWNAAIIIQDPFSFSIPNHSDRRQAIKIEFVVVIMLHKEAPLVDLILVEAFFTGDNS
jgi:hypothetical protein